MIGQKIGHYDITVRLGAGGMGQVYRARDPRLERDVAIKVVNPTLTGDRSAVDRFVREARTVSRLNHPNIVTIHDIGESDAGRFIVTELVDGRTLRDVVTTRVALATAVDIARQVALALAAAHAVGIVHRDVKPENVMVRRDALVKVLDFGLARLAPDGGADANATASGTAPGIVLGTLRYMAPEQAAGQPVEASADVFALGLVLYELLTGQHAFGRGGGWAVVGAIATEAALPASRLEPTVPAALDDLLLRMLDKDPLKRPTALEVANLLGRVAPLATGDPVAGTPVRSVATMPATVGRNAELATLRAAFDAATGGAGLMVTVSGEPGIGKTTVVEDFLATLEHEGLARIARGRCSERLAGTEAYLPWLEALDDLIRGASGAEMAHLLQQVAPSWYQQVAPSGVVEGGGSTPRAASQERIKRDAVLFLQEAVRVRPLVLFIDDVHWADESTVDLLAYVGSRLSSLRLLVIATYRPSELALSRHPFGSLKLELQSRRVCREMALAFLTADDLDAYLRREFPNHRFPREFSSLIHARTEGSPLFVRGLLHDLSGRGLVAETDGEWRLVGDLSAIGRDLPESVRAMIQRAIARLEDPDRDLLIAASVQGYEFDSAIVARAAGRAAADVEERLDHLEHVHTFLVRVGERDLPDRTLSVRYRFAHVMYQNVLYGALTPTRRATLSGAVAEALVTHHGATKTDVATELALLFEAARDNARAAEQFLVAARRAARIFAHGEAITLARRGLALVESLPEGRARDDRELDLRMVLGAALSETKGFSSPEVEVVFARARVLCDQAIDPVRHFPVLHGLRDFYYTRGEQAAASRLQVQLDALADSVDHPVLRFQAHHSRWTALVGDGRFADARTCLDEGLALYDRERYRASEYAYGHDPAVCGLVFSSLAHWALGHADRALDDCQRARTLARELAHPSSEGQAGFYSAMLHQLQGEVESARDYAEATIRLTRDQGFAFFLAYARVVRGWARAAAGERAEGVAEMREALDAMRAAGTRYLRPYCQGLLAEGLLLAGHDDAGAVIADGLDESAQTGQCFAVSELHRLQGESFVAAGDRARASDCFREALAVARLQGSPAFERKAAASLARLSP